MLDHCGRVTVDLLRHPRLRQKDHRGSPRGSGVLVVSAVHVTGHVEASELRWDGDLGPRHSVCLVALSGPPGPTAVRGAFIHHDGSLRPSASGCERRFDNRVERGEVCCRLEAEAVADPTFIINDEGERVLAERARLVRLAVGHHALHQIEGSSSPDSVSGGSDGKRREPKRRSAPSPDDEALVRASRRESQAGRTGPSVDAFEQFARRNPKPASDANKCREANVALAALQASNLCRMQVAGGGEVFLG